MFKRIDHVGIATRSIDQALSFYRGICHLHADDTVELHSQRVKVCMVHVGDSMLELIEPTDTTSAVSRFIQRRGEGLLHICFETDDINRQLGLLAGQGVELVDRQPWQSPHGLAAFIHPKATYGVSIELRQYEKDKT